ncbi:MAG: AAA family ATPase, partial [Candidatus Uhrbacteria bacterium]|nr:AAA family ATPase [Candidatus Uhrbacteria bacterium]
MELPTTWIAAIIVLLLAGVFLLRRKSQDESLNMPSGSFTRDLSLMAARNELEPFDGRQQEVERTIHIIMRRSKNNPLLIGNPGVGKTAIVHGLAQRIHDGNVPKSLANKRVLELDLNAILAGSQYRGEMEKRLRTLLASLERDSRKIILFIDEVHMLTQANGAQGSLNVSDILKPALSRG